MSTLSKLFVVLIVVLALVLLGVNATLFAMRADFKHKWVEEVKYHHQTQMIKSAELADAGSKLEARDQRIVQMTGQMTTLENEVGSARTQLEEAKKEIAVKQTEIDKQVASLATLARQLEVQLASIDETMKKLDEQRTRANAAHAKAMTATQDLQYQRQEAERLSKDLGQLESTYQELARDRQRLQETIANLNAAGIRTDQIAPRKPLSGKVTAVASELDLVVISIGRDAGVNEGDEFSLSRGSSFTGKIVIDRVDRAWASGRVMLKGKEAPAVGDDASNNILAAPGKSGN